MKTFENIVDDVFVKEGDKYSAPPANDQPTARGGITLQTLIDFYKVQWPNAPTPTIEDLQRLTHEEARVIVEWKLYQLAAEMRLNTIFKESDNPLYLLLLDFGYNSGGPRAIRWFQRCLEVPASGEMDIVTVSTLMDLRKRVGGSIDRLLHQALIAARLQMVDMWADAPENRKFEEGLENRVLSFSLLKV